MSETDTPEWRMKTPEFIGLLATISALTALAIDLMLPTFGDVREYYDLAPDSSATARIVTFFFLGFAGQIFFGPLSDRFGRLAVMRAGFGLYVIGCLGSAFAPSLDLMLLARLLWGVGAGALQVSALAMIRDRFHGDEMARILSFVLMVFLIIPIIAPVLGKGVLSVSSWRVVFLVPLVVAVGVFVWSLRLVESLPPPNRLPELRLKIVVEAMRVVLSNRQTVRYVVAQTVAFAAFSSYLASSERIVGEIYDREELFVPMFVGVSILMAVMSAVNATVVTKIGSRRAAGFISLVSVLVGGTLLVLALLSDGLPSIAVFLWLFPLLVGLNGMAEPNFGALALEPQGDQAGIAAAIYGSAYIALGAAIGAVIDGLIGSTITPLIVGFTGAAALALLLVITDSVVPRR